MIRLLRRTGYLLYYLKSLDIKKYGAFLTFASGRTGKSRAGLIAGSLLSVYRYNISLIDYFYFRFFESYRDECDLWAGTGFMYEYQLKMNPAHARKLLENKIEFNEFYKDYLKRRFVTLKEIKADKGKLISLMQNGSGRIVLKNSRGQAGKEVAIIEIQDTSAAAILKMMVSRGYDLAEEYLIQHPLMMALSPSGLNTVRVITQISEGSVEIIAARLRISVSSPVDNLAAGNAAAPVDIITGVVDGPAVFSDITKESINVHPVTGEVIKGFRIPFWDEVINLAIKAASFTPDNRSVGWDIAVTAQGPALIEGNHNWCKLLWQLPVKKGLKYELERYL